MPFKPTPLPCLPWMILMYPCNRSPCYMSLLQCFVSPCFQRFPFNGPRHPQLALRSACMVGDRTLLFQGQTAARTCPLLQPCSRLSLPVKVSTFHDRLQTLARTHLSKETTKQAWWMDVHRREKATSWTRRCEGIRAYLQANRAGRHARLDTIGRRDSSVRS